GAIDDIRLAQNERALIHRHEIRLQARSGHETSGHKDPIRGLDFIRLDQVIRRQWRPAGILVTVTPIDPCRAPFVAGDPKPTGPALEGPTAIMKDDPAPISFDII